MYNLSEHLENIGSNLRQAFQNGGNVMPKYRAVIELPGGKVRWLAGNTAQELARQAFELGKEYPRDIQCPFFKEYVPRILTNTKSLRLNQRHWPVIIHTLLVTCHRSLEMFVSIILMLQ